MGLTKMEVQRYAILGGVASLIVPWINKVAVIPILGFLAGFLPDFRATLAAANPGTVQLNVRESLRIGLQDTAFGQKLFGYIPMTLPDWAILAAGGAAVFVLGAWVAEMVGGLKGDKRQRITAVLFFGTLGASLFVTGAIPNIDLGFVNMLIAFGVNALVIGFVIALLDDQADFNLVP